MRAAGVPAVVAEDVMMALPSGVADGWRYGNCYPMAAAISDRLGWPVVVLTVTTTRPERPRQVVHAWTRSPDGRAFDASGFFDEIAYVETLLADTSRWSDKSIDELDGSAALLAHLEDCYRADFGWDEYRDRDLPRMVAEAMREVDAFLVPLADAEVSSGPVMGSFAI